MKLRNTFFPVFFLIVLCGSCMSSYKWQRKKYYQNDPRKNWNYQKPDRLPNK